MALSSDPKQDQFTEKFGIDTGVKPCVVVALTLSEFAHIEEQEIDLDCNEYEANYSEEKFLGGTRFLVRNKKMGTPYVATKIAIMNENGNLASRIEYWTEALK